MHSEFGKPDYLQAAKESADWVIRNMHSYLLFARPSELEDHSNRLSNLFYSFDNGMIVIGLINMYKTTQDKNFLLHAKKITEALIERFFDGEKLTPRLNSSFRQISAENEDDIVKWSTVSGPYHCKLSMGLLELSRLTNNIDYAQVSNSLCDYAKRYQESNGRFITNPGSQITFLHPHLYACEGLIYSGLMQSNDNHLDAGLTGLRWAIEWSNSNNTKALTRNTREKSVEQSDCTAQLLRLLTLCRSKFGRFIGESKLDGLAERLHSRLLDFYVPDGENQGGMRYQLSLDSVCSWCTMFSMQALRLWSKKNYDSLWADYFI